MPLLITGRLKAWLLIAVCDHWLSSVPLPPCCFSRAQLEPRSLEILSQAAHPHGCSSQSSGGSHMDRSQAESEVLSAAVTHSWNSSAHRPCGTQKSLQVLGPKPESWPWSGRKERMGELPGAGDRYVYTGTATLPCPAQADSSHRARSIPVPATYASGWWV